VTISNHVFDCGCKWEIEQDSDLPLVHINFCEEHIKHLEPSVLKIRTLGSDKYKWVDKDYILLHASFELLVQFIENEWIPFEGLQDKPFSEFEEAMRKWCVELRSGGDMFSDADKEQADAQEALLDLYKWWTIEHPEEIRHRHDSPEDLKKFDKREQEMLEKLIKYRGAMWT